MKTRLSSIILAAVCGLAPIVSTAQSKDLLEQIALPAKGEGAVGFYKKIPSDGKVNLPGRPETRVLIPETPRLKVSRAWSEREALLRIPFINDGATEMSILGVQSTGALFIVSYPNAVAIDAKGEILVRYYAEPGSNADLDLVKLVTNQGIKVIEIEQDREPVVVFETTVLRWKVGEDPHAKSVYFVVAANTVTAVGARVFGDKGKAALTDLGGGKYRVDITPETTEKPVQFPVAIDFKPTITGVSNVIYVTVVTQ